MASPHPSTVRLLEAAQSATKTSRDPVKDWRSLRERMGVTSAVLANWKARGLSKEAAIAAEQLFGCSVQYLLTGENPPTDLSPLAFALGRHLDRMAGGSQEMHIAAYAAAIAVIDMTTRAEAKARHPLKALI